MSCNCQQISKEKQSYENIKKIAQLYSKNQNEVVKLYKTSLGFGFIETKCEEAKQYKAIEYILPM
jgi:hypothetical protein